MVVGYVLRYAWDPNKYLSVVVLRFMIVPMLLLLKHFLYRNVILRRLEEGIHAQVKLL